MKNREYGLFTMVFYGGSVACIVGAAICALFSVLLMSLALPFWANVVFFVAAVQIGTLLAKILFFCWFFVWVRWTLPRLRYDQIMHLGWKIMLNVALVNLLITAAVLQFLGKD